MNKKLIIRIQGAILSVEAAAMLPALIIAIYDRSEDWKVLLPCMLGLFTAGAMVWLFVRPAKGVHLRLKEGFLIVAAGWLELSIGGALPFFFSGRYRGFTDALFESVSGFTTTGATVLTQFEGYPRGLMFWRATTHWIGGMGVLVLTLALLPRLTGRTSHLVRAESPGPSLSKLVPHTAATAKILYRLYILLTLAEFLSLLLCGLSPYDAALHSLSTAGTGGFSNYSASVAAFQNVWAEAVICTFMFLFGVNFALYYKFLISEPGKRFLAFFRDEEFRWYLSTVSLFILLISVFNLNYFQGDFLRSFRYGAFEICTVMSTTGFVTGDFTSWPVASQMLIICGMFLGACAGSTAGGIKIVRAALLGKLASRSVRSTVQPRKVKVIRLDGKAVEESMLSQVAVFGIIYFFLVIFGSFLLSLENHFDLITNLTAALTCISNVGPGFGSVASDFAGYGVFSKLVCCFLMLAGRLELFPMLILLSRSIWKTH